MFLLIYGTWTISVLKEESVWRGKDKGFLKISKIVSHTPHPCPSVPSWRRSRITPNDTIYSTTRWSLSLCKSASADIKHEGKKFWITLMMNVQSCCHRSIFFYISEIKLKVIIEQNSKSELGPVMARFHDVSIYCGTKLSVHHLQQLLITIRQSPIWSRGWERRMELEEVTGPMAVWRGRRDSSPGSMTVLLHHLYTWSTVSFSFSGPEPIQ